MPFDSTPWFVGGGAEHSAEVARVLAYAATGASEGVVEPLGLKVRPLNVPGAGVQVGPGACLLLNRYPAGGEQTYVGRHNSTSTVAVTPTSSAGQRTDLLIARVIDPQYEGEAPADPNAFDYLELDIVPGVPFQAGAAYAATLGYPAIALAKWTLPPSTGTITAGMITDLRTLAQPRTLRSVQMGTPVLNDALLSPSGVGWPQYSPEFQIPGWATHMSVVATIASIGYQNGSVHGTLAVSAGPAGPNQWRSSDTYYDLDVAPNDGARTTLVIGGSAPIPPALRGFGVTLRTEGKRDVGSGALITRAGTHIVYDVQFTEGLL